MLDVSAGTSLMPDIVTAEPQHAERVFGTITLAFATDPPSRWLFPETPNFLQHFPVFARALGGGALPRRTGFATRDYSAVILWLAPDDGPDEEAMAKLMEEGMAPDRRADMGALIEEMTRYHPHEPHWYLPFIAVDPSRQGRGLGDALLRRSLARCDADKLPAYLESTNPRNQPLYERHGFEAVGEIKIGNGPPIVPMLRRPRV